MNFLKALYHGARIIVIGWAERALFALARFFSWVRRGGK